VYVASKNKKILGVFFLLSNDTNENKAITALNVIARGGETEKKKVA
jgi:hypothetical protein